MRRAYLFQSDDSNGTRGGVTNTDGDLFELEVGNRQAASTRMLALCAHFDEIMEYLKLVDSHVGRMIYSSIEAEERRLLAEYSDRMASPTVQSESQMTLGGLIDRLSQLDPSTEIYGIGNPHSYRGYYKDLAFELCSNKRTVTNILIEAKYCLGRDFVGYKGGDFRMARDTLIWVANKGCLGEKIISIGDDGLIATAKDELYTTMDQA
jgi:hypothetical protein